MLRTRRQVIEIPCGRRGWGVGVENRHPPPKRIFFRVAKKIAAVAVHAANAATSDRDCVWTTCVGVGVENRWNHRLQKKTGCNGLLNFQEEKAN